MNKSVEKLDKDLHLFFLRQQAGLVFLRVSIFIQELQGQVTLQALLGQKHVLQGEDNRWRQQKQ